MTSEHEAEEHLRAIRQLMERATIYRAISAPTALVGGVLSILTALLMFQWLKAAPAREIDARIFFAIWVVVLVLTLAANTVFIVYRAGREGEPLLSAGMMHALRSVAPSFFAGGVISASPLLMAKPYPALAVLTVLVWLVFYGLGLLATDSFAPRSIIALGWAFVVTGVALIVLSVIPGGLYLLTPYLPVAIMGITFGGYHLCYAAIVWVRDRQRSLDAAEHRPLLSHGYPPLP